MFIELKTIVGLIISAITFGLAMCAPGAPNHSSIGRFTFGGVWIVAMIVMWSFIDHL